MEMTTPVTYKLVPEFLRALVGVLLDKTTHGFTDLTSQPNALPETKITAEIIEQ